MFEKRGISPLIATVLIIGFTVALAAVIITWGGQFLTQTQEDVDVQATTTISCSKLDIDVTDVTCLGSGLSSVLVKNQADIIITDVIIRATDDSGNVFVDETSGGAPLPIGEFGVGSVSWSGSTVNMPKSVEVIPKINNNQACSAVARTFNIPDSHACRAGGGPATEDCSVAGDEDGDGFFDCADSDCAGLTGPSGEVCEPAGETICSDGFDNNGDTFADCLDTDCIGNADCRSLADGASCVDGTMCVNEYCNPSGICETPSASITACGSLSGGTGTDVFAVTTDLVASVDTTCIDMGTSGRILDCQGHTITVSGASGIGVVISSLQTVQRCNIVSQKYGIRIDSSAAATIQDNTITVNSLVSTATQGIFFNSGAASNSVLRNTVSVDSTDTDDGGIFFSIGASGNILKDNNLCGVAGPKSFGEAISSTIQSSSSSNNRCQVGTCGLNPASNVCDGSLNCIGGASC